jgi:hypothetical protein
MQFTTFEQACAGCHDQGQADHHGDQIRAVAREVLPLPTLKMDKAGPWTDNTLASGSSLTPMLQFLIVGDTDPAALQALQSLASDKVAKGSIDDWDAEDTVKSQLAAAIRRVAEEISLPDLPAPASPNPKVLERIARAAGVPKDSPVALNLLDQLRAARNVAIAWQQYRAASASGVKGNAETQAADTQPTTGEAEWRPPGDFSGWFVDTKAVSVDYRPSHADLLDQSFTELLARGSRQDADSGSRGKPTTQEPSAALRSGLLPALLRQGNVCESCIKCHAVQPQNDSFFVNWHAAGHTTHVAGYVKFVHRPHVTSFSDIKECFQCHKLQAAGSVTAASSEPTSPAEFLFPSGAPNHGMAAHSKTECIACHTPAGAPDSCVTCHLYHMKR